MFQDFNYLRKYILLNAINHFGPVSRTSLVELSGYRPATVGAFISEFIEDKLVVESESISVGQGRKRTLLEINRAHLCTICISFSPKHINPVVIQSDGKIIANQKSAFSTDAPTKEDAEAVAKTVQFFMESFRDKMFIGIGLCEFLFESFQPKAALNEWIKRDLMPLLHAISDIPTYYFNDVSLPSIAEKSFGVAKDVQNFMWINMANEIRASLYFGGHDIKGACNAAGALGHSVVDYHEHDTLCACGRRGCVEDNAAWPAIKQKIVSAMRNGVTTKLNEYGVAPEDITVVEVRRALDEGDRLCKYYVKQSAQEIGLAIANAVNLLNPEMLVTHGFMLRLGKTFKGLLESTIRENVLPENENIEILLSDDFENPMLMGAAAEIFSAYLVADNYQWLYTIPVTSHE